MKNLRISVWGFLAAVTISSAQQFNDSGWYRAGDDAGATMPINPQTNQIQAHVVSGGAGQILTPNYAGIPTAPVAEIITPEIQSLANGLQNDPVKIFNYVHDNIRYVLYFGSKKGAQLTLLEKSGNDFDQSALLVALLRAAGYTNSPGADKGVGYQFGWELLPFDSADHKDLHHWLGLNFNNTNWNSTTVYLYNLFSVQRGYPTYYYSTSDTNTFWFQRVWVTLTLGATNYYYLDPAFKISEPIIGVANLAGAMGFSSNSLMSAAAGTDTGNYATNLNETALRNSLTSYTTNLLGYLQSNYPNTSVSEILGGQAIVPSTNTTLAKGLLFPFYEWNQAGQVMPIVNWSNIPTNLISKLTVTFAGTNFQWYFPQLLGQRAALTFDTGGTAQLWQDDTLLAQRATSGSSSRTNVVFYVNHPYGAWNYSNNIPLDTGKSDQLSTNSYQRTNSTYAILYGFEPDWDWLQKRQNQLDNYRQQGLADASRQVVSETLNVMGLNWMLQCQSSEQIMASQLGILVQYHHRIGRMAQESGKGYYVDVYAITSGEISNAGPDPANRIKEDNEFALTTIWGSALEHGIIEQLQNTNLTGASTIKMLQIANNKGQAIYLASSTNWMTAFNVSNKLVNYDSTAKTEIGRLINSGYFILLPQNGSNQVAGTSSWGGFGYEGMINTSSNQDCKMRISGNYNGGYVSDATATANAPYVNQVGDSQPQSFTATPPFTPVLTGADPVNMADGTFQIEHTDLSLGQGEPKGITLSRYYNSARRFSNPAGLSPGWTHNYAISANPVPAPQAGLGGTTPAQAAAMITAMTAIIGIYDQAQPKPKNWLVTALIAKWGVDQLSKNGASITLGKDTVQFVKQPDDTFTPPANCTMTLTQSNSAFSLQQRHGNRFNFDTTGHFNAIIDPYNNSLTATYTNNYVRTVSDWKGRSLTFNYSGSQLTSVTDSAGRSVAYGFSTQGDLNSFTDPESKTSTYLCDTNHQVVATLDALNRLVVSNIFDGFGHVTTQYTQGDTNKAWQIFWSGWQTVEQDPAGGQRTFYFADQGLFTGLRDQLGNLTQDVYDGQNHIIATISPLNETNRFIFDGNHNVIYSVDPLGFTNQSVFDAQNNLIRSIDPRGIPSTFGYNAQFSLVGATNGAGDFVNYAFNTDGTPQSRTDAGGTTAFDGYDSYGQLNHITYPNGLGTESFVNSFFGDVISHTDGNGNVNTFGFNNRRQLTNSIAPTNRVTKAGFDPVGNQASVTDARGNVTSNTWSATRNLLTTTLPAMPQGVPVITNAYDNRDWLIKTVDPLQRATLYTNDAAGRLFSQTDPLLRKTSFRLDANGRKLASTNAALIVTRQTWDKRGQPVQLSDGAGHVSSRGYDPAGNQTTLTNRNSKKWQFQFDAANRATNTISPRGFSTSVVFNHQGKISSTKDAANQPTTLLYDAKKRMINRADNVGSTAYGFDPNDNPTSVVENGQTNALAYDAYNQVISYKDVYGNLIQYRQDANGNVTNLIYPGGKNVYYAFDSNNHLTNVTDWSNRKTAIVCDLAGQITSIVRPNGTYRTVGFDVAGQATNILEQMPNSLPIAWFKLNWTNTGNMAWEFTAPLPHPANVPTRTMTYDDDNRLATVNGQTVYSDANGNLTNAPLTNATLAAHVFDARNRLLNVGGVTNVYDAMDNRIRQNYGTNVTTFVVNPNAKLPQVLLRIKNGVTNYYIYGVGLLYQITETATGTNTLTYNFDFRGSTVALTDDSGKVTDRIEYSAYGLTTYRTGTNDTPFLFNGRYGVMTDPNGLLYMRARYYNPYLCRFISADPSGFGGGLNHYAYANGNPVSLFDPFGLGAVGESATASWFSSSYQQIGNAAMEANADTFGNAVDFTMDFFQGIGQTLNNINQALTPMPDAMTGTVPIMPFGSGGFSAAKDGARIIFGTEHALPHFVGTGLNQTAIEAEIGSRVGGQIFSGIPTSVSGPFMGRLNFSGQIIEYRGFGLPNGVINIGTYYPKILSP